MHILVTGGTGFIGQALLPALHAQGHSLTVLSRDPQRRRVPEGVRLIDDLDSLAPQPPQAVVNLQGENLGAGRWTAERKSAFVKSRVDFTRGLVEHFRRWRQPPRVLVSGSAIGWYGDRGEETLTEASAPGQGFAAELCQRWEAAARLAEPLGVRVACLRIGVVLGLPGGALGQMLTPFRLGLGGRLGSGRQWMSWVHREDLVALIGWLLERDEARGAYNGTAPVPVRNAEFTAALGATLRRPAVLPMPAPMLRLMMGEMAEALLLGGQRVLPERALAEGFHFRFPGLAEALADVLAR